MVKAMIAAPEIEVLGGPYGFDTRPGPWSPRELTVAEREAVTADLARLESTMVPAGPEHVEKCLAHLSLLVQMPQSMTAAEGKAKLRAYAHQLSGYPAEAISRACQEHARTSRWFPTLSELVQPIEAAISGLAQAKARMTALLDYRPRVGQARIGNLVRLVTAR